jgi:rhodanese-related sulfurtransferase
MKLNNFKSAAPQIPDEVDVIQALNMSKQGTLLLDVREPNEHAEIHAPNTMLIPLGQLKTRFNEVASNKEQPIAILCRSGVRSAAAVLLLLDAGYSQVSNIKGGIMAWERAGLPVIRR